MSKEAQGFTLIELLVVIAGIVIIAAIVFVAVNPYRRFAESRNSRRQVEIKSILDAVNLYVSDNGKYPLGIDDSLKMLGTAGNSCEAICGQEEVAEIDNPHSSSEGLIAKIKTNLLDNNIANAASSAVAFSSSSDPGTGGTDARDGNTGIGRMKANILGNNINDATPSSIAWISPSGDQDPGNQWTDRANAYDGNTSSYASNNYSGAGWGQYLILTLSEPVLSDRLRIKADYLDSVIQEVQVDVLENGVWVNAFDGGSESVWNGKYAEITFPKGSVSQFRFRYNYKVSGYYFWLYEAQIYQSAAVISPPVCAIQNATAIQRTAAILHGLVADDGGEPCQYRFNYGKTTAYTNTTDWTGSQETNDLLSELVVGLAPGTQYHFQTVIKNSAGTVNCPDNSFTTKVVDNGWVLPTGYNDSDNRWDLEANAYDDIPSTFAMDYHNIGDPLQSSYYYFTHDPIASDRIKFLARGDSEVDGAEVDVLRDGAWVNVYNGPVNNLQWMEVGFTQGLVTQARIRFSTPYGNHGFFWELYEFGFKKSTATSDTSCLDLSTSLTPRYLPTVPHDPLIGSDSKTYYAIKKRSDGSVTVVACNAELGQYFETTR
jgi:prepilin-type N-terminal cleavage/methylation domain-containing protein